MDVSQHPPPSKKDVSRDLQHPNRTYATSPIRMYRSLAIMTRTFPQSRLNFEKSSSDHPRPKFPSQQAPDLSNGTSRPKQLLILVVYWMTRTDGEIRKIRSMHGPARPLRHRFRCNYGHSWYVFLFSESREFSFKIMLLLVDFDDERHRIAQFRNCKIIWFIIH